MSDILRQVDEDLRKDKLFQLWKKYGLYLIAFIIIIVTSVIGYQISNSLNKTYNEKIVESYINAINNENINEQILLLTSIDDSKNSFISSLIDLKVSNLQIQSGNIEESLLMLDEISQNENSNLIIKDLATYYILMKNIDKITEDKFMSYLNSERINRSSFKFLFEELIAIKKLLSGEIDESKNRFQALIDYPTTPENIKIRASKFIEITR